MVTEQTLEILMGDARASQPRPDAPTWTRRAFLTSTAKTGAILAMPTIIPATALGRGGAVPPSERILVGGIGIGNRGSSDMRWMMGEKDIQFMAICDIRKSRREAVKKAADEKYGNSDCTMHRDIREFLAERTDLDAVLIATGDRWHTLASIMAMRAGKDVYCEKPSCMTISQGQLWCRRPSAMGAFSRPGRNG